MRTALLLLGLGWVGGCNSAPAATGPGVGGGGNGDGGANGMCAAASNFHGDKIDAPDNEWTWIPVAGNKCRDGSDTGIGVRINPASDKLIIYLEGGGACFQGTSCFSNPNYFDSAAFDGVKSRATGIFDFANAANPFKDYSFVYVPYCTGDVHAGNADGVEVPGGGPFGQHFVGYGNMTRGLERLVTTFPNVTQVVLSGSSAGGFGASFNYHQTAEAFCPRPVTLIDDSGPPMTDQYLAACLQKRWRDLWQLDTTLPADCADCRDAEGGGLVNYIPYLAAKYPNVQLGLISSDKDSVIPRFYGFGQNMCASLDQGGGTMTPDEFRTGLLDMRDNFLVKSPNWGSYFISSTQHTWLGSNSFYRTTSGGVAMVDWVTQLVTTHTSANVGP